MTTPIYSLGEFLQVAHDEIWKIELWMNPFHLGHVKGLKITLHDESTHFYHRDGVTAEDPQYPSHYIEVDER